ncbi:MAG: RNA-binding protein [Cyanobacteria bacterium J083]|nr:MAG: RNA-binding protein [Cyanobacteria bacterium J083]
MSDQQLEQGQQWLESLLKLMGLPTEVSLVTFPQSMEDNSSPWLVIETDQLTPEQVKILIGEKGETIDAIQYLANVLLHLNLPPEVEQHSLTIEIDSYRLHRQTELLAIAEQAAKQARATGSEVEIPALSSAERRQIHSFFQKSADLATESRGQEPDRRLIVKLNLE